MDFQFTESEKNFKNEVRDFTKKNLSTELKNKLLHYQTIHKDDVMSWHKSLFDKGWIAPSWPKSFGGCEWNSVQKFIFDYETSFLGAPRLSPFGLTMIGPVIINFGSEFQKNRFLPKILSGEEWWCQGYSEPGSGSDLASLKTKAELKNGKYVVNGQKTWTSYAHWADYIFCLVRTSNENRRQDGISMLLIDMRSEGVEVRSINTMGNEDEVNEVWFNNVEVPAENLVGEEGKAWSIAKFLLSNERTSIAAVGAARKDLEYIKHLSLQKDSNGYSLSSDDIFNNKFIQLSIEIDALEWTVLRIASDTLPDKAGDESSIIKIRATEIQQRLTELMLEAGGMNAMPYLPLSWSGNWVGPRVSPEITSPLTSRYLNYRKVSIYGGTNEIQKNIIAKQVLKI